MNICSKIVKYIIVSVIYVLFLACEVVRSLTFGWAWRLHEGVCLTLVNEAGSYKSANARQAKLHALVWLDFVGE